MDKGVIFDIKRYAVHDGPGIRTTIFLQGCPLTCWWCHNPEGIRRNPTLADLDQSVTRRSRLMTVSELLAEIEKDVLFYDESGGGVTFSGGEPLVQHRFLREIVCECRTRDIHTTLDTTGYASREIMASLMDDVDLFHFDLKLIDLEQHEAYTGVSNEPIKQNLRLLAEHQKRVIIRFPLIPGITDTQENLDGIVAFVGPLAGIDTVHILPFHKTAGAKYRRLQQKDLMTEFSPPSPERIESVRDFFEQYGFKAKVGG